MTEILVRNLLMKCMQKILGEFANKKAIEKIFDGTWNLDFLGLVDYCKLTEFLGMYQ